MTLNSCLYPLDTGVMGFSHGDLMCLFLMFLFAQTSLETHTAPITLSIKEKQFLRPASSQATQLLSGVLDSQHATVPSASSPVSIHLRLSLL